jgi:hypothetical protein
MLIAQPRRKAQHFLVEYMVLVEASHMGCTIAPNGDDAQASEGGKSGSSQPETGNK